MLMRPSFALPALGLALLASSVWAAPAAELSRLHAFQDWYLACDNTLACEAQGYSPEDAAAWPILLQLRRVAGPGTPVTATFRLGNFSSNGQDMARVRPTADVPIHLSVGPTTLTLGPLNADGSVVLNDEQTARLLPWLNRADTLVLSAGAQRWTVSLKGASAALLKMDDLQDRLDTPGALVGVGQRPETQVPLPLPLPDVLGQAVPEPHREDALLLPLLRRSISEVPESCPLLTEGRGQVWRLGSGQVMAVLDCWQAVYNSGSGAWTSSILPPYAPQAVRFATPVSESGAAWAYTPTFLSLTRTESGALMADSVAKGRGTGDCVHHQTWVWNGQFFALTGVEVSPCRQFSLGGQPLTLWRAQVR
ncbi:MAG: hypothetical protein RLZZ494_1469 [Pseudomonadota bacterium]|jgi:hypothetical protein